MTIKTDNFSDSLTDTFSDDFAPPHRRRAGLQLDGRPPEMLARSGRRGAQRSGIKEELSAMNRCLADAGDSRRDKRHGGMIFRGRCM